MNPLLAAIAAATVVLLAAGAFGTWKVLGRIRQAVEHIEEHFGDQPSGIIQLPDYDDGQASSQLRAAADHLTARRAAADRAGLFAPNPREGS